MNSVSIRKIPASLFSADVTPQRRKGSVTLAATLMSLVLTILGLSMIFLSQIHLKAAAARKHSAVLDYASENGIKQGLADMIAGLDSKGMLAELPPDLMDDYRTDAFQGGSKIVEDFFGWTFPHPRHETWDKMIWDSTTACVQEKFEALDDFFSADYKLQIDSEGRLSGFKPKRSSSLDVSLGVLAGRIPLPCIPFLINKKMNPAESRTFKKESLVSFRTGAADGAVAGLQIEENPVIPAEAPSLLAKTLKINIFRPEDLNNAVLRRAIGLEISDDPAPDGVYLIKDDLGLGGVYIQGDAEAVVTAIDGDYQVIFFRTQQGEWTLKFSPAAGKTFFITPETSSAYDLVPAGIIAVNGQIRSLEGGVIDPSGRVVPAGNEAVPSILAGISLTFLSSEAVTITGHLFSQGIRWKDGVPYVKDSQSEIIIYSTGKDFVDGTNQEAKITIAEGSPRNLTIQASLVAQGKGVIMEGIDKEVEILGGIQAMDYSSKGNKLYLTPGCGSDLPLSLETAPKTSVPMLYFSSFKIREWKEY